MITAGDDQGFRQTLIHDTWSNLTGLTAEYALLVPGKGDTLACGLESALAVAQGSVREGADRYHPQEGDDARRVS